MGDDGSQQHHEYPLSCGAIQTSHSSYIYRQTDSTAPQESNKYTMESRIEKIRAFNRDIPS
jgi:hypothetical protein